MALLIHRVRANNFKRYSFMIIRHQTKFLKFALVDSPLLQRFNTAPDVTMKCMSSTWSRENKLNDVVPRAMRHFYCTGEIDVKKEVDSISEKFSESLELLNDAKSSLGTVYFSEDMKDAEEMVEETLNNYRLLLEKLKEKQRLDIQKTIGLKMEELQAQLQMIKDSIKE